MSKRKPRIVDLTDPDVVVPDHEPFTLKQREWLTALYSEHLVASSDLGAHLDRMIEVGDLTQAQAQEIADIADQATAVFAKRLPMAKRMRKVGNRS